VPAPNPIVSSFFLVDRRHLRMRATVKYGAGDVRVEDVPDARLIEPTDALVRVTRAAICGSDLWPYKSMPHDNTGRRMGHEFIGVVDSVGSDVATTKAGDLVLALPLVGRQLHLLPRGAAE
jgi:threonine dehydrogenase-like Zn-dependent dehydrogenase